MFVFLFFESVILTCRIPLSWKTCVYLCDTIFLKACVGRHACFFENVIFFETQFGKLHQQTGHFIDWQIWISLPPEIALSRQVATIINNILQSPATEHTAGLEWVRNYLSEYPGFVRNALLNQQQWLEASADLNLDGTLDTASNTATLLDFLMKHSDS